jgi:hypothetical protein
MTDTAAPSLPPASRDRSALALAGSVVAFALVNSLATWFENRVEEGYWSYVMMGVLVSQPTLFGVWTALGAGSILTRVPIAIPCLILLFVAPGYVPPTFADVRRVEFIQIVLAGLAIYTATLLLLLVFRRFTGFRIQLHSTQPADDRSGITFSMQYLLALITAYAVALGLAAQLKFDTTPQQPNLLFGPNFFISILVFGGSILFAAVLPTLFVPLSILHGHSTRRAVISAIGFWVAVTFSIMIIVIAMEGGGLRSTFEYLGFVQLGAILAGALAALALRFAGLRLVRYRPDATQSSGISSPVPSP